MEQKFIFSLGIWLIFKITFFFINSWLSIIFNEFRINIFPNTHSLLRASVSVDSDRLSLHETRIRCSVRSRHHLLHVGSGISDKLQRNTGNRGELREFIDFSGLPLVSHHLMITHLHLEASGPEIGETLRIIDCLLEKKR